MANGDKYTGEFAYNNIDGYGVYEYASYVDLSRDIVPSARYEGSFKRGKRHGQGIYHMRNGDVYSGWFADDLFEGEGCLTLQKGGSITGSFRKGKPNGKCKVAYANGDTYEGDMVAGEPEGGIMNICAATGLKHVAHDVYCRPGQADVSRWLHGQLRGRLAPRRVPRLRQQDICEWQ